MNASIQNAKYTVVYLAYGLDSGKYQAVLSIYSLCHHLVNVNDVAIVIYTDNDHRILNKYLSGLPVRLETITKEQIKSYKGEKNFILRVKPCIIKDYFSNYKGELFYIDTDTFFLRDPTPVFESIRPGYTIMNAAEYNFLDAGEVELAHWFVLRQALKRSTYTVNGNKVAIPLATVMWNSGIVGMSQADAGLIDQIINLIDEVYSQYPTFIVEQFAISYFLQSATQLRSTEDYINHYWLKEVKNSFNLRIPAFLQENAHKSGKELYALAFEFAKEVGQIHTSVQDSLTTRINARLKLIMKVARKGYL